MNRKELMDKCNLLLDFNVDMFKIFCFIEDNGYRPEEILNEILFERKEE